MHRRISAFEKRFSIARVSENTRSVRIDSKIFSVRALVVELYWRVMILTIPIIEYYTDSITHRGNLLLNGIWTRLCERRRF